MSLKTLLTPKVIFFTFIIIGVLLEVGGDFFFKKWSIENKKWILIVGLLIYFSGAYFWAVSLRYEGLAKAVSIFTILNLIIAALIGVLYFNEELSWTNKIGIVLGLLSILFIEL